MAKYKIVVIKYDDNQNYQAEMAKFKEDGLRNDYRNSNYMADAERDLVPQKESASRSLEVILTEEEYGKVKEAVLATFK